eukprot:6512792-Prymnesium_polylepis.1
MNSRILASGLPARPPPPKQPAAAATAVAARGKARDMARWLDADLFCGHAPSMFPSFALSPSVCADVSAAARAHSEERDLDSVVRGRFQPAGGADRAAEPAHTSRLLRLLSEARELTHEQDPLAALASALREVKEARKTYRRFLKSTGQSNADAALVTIEIALRENA